MPKKKENIFQVINYLFDVCYQYNINIDSGDFEEHLKVKIEDGLIKNVFKTAKITICQKIILC